MNWMVSITSFFPFPDLGPNSIKAEVAHPLVTAIMNMLTKGNHSELKIAPSLLATPKAVPMKQNLSNTLVY